MTHDLSKHVEGLFLFSRRNSLHLRGWSIERRKAGSNLEVEDICFIVTRVAHDFHVNIIELLAEQDIRRARNRELKLAS